MTVSRPSSADPVFELLPGIYMSTDGHPSLPPRTSYGFVMPQRPTLRRSVVFPSPRDSSVPTETISGPRGKQRRSAKASHRTKGSAADGFGTTKGRAIPGISEAIE